MLPTKYTYGRVFSGKIEKIVIYCKKLQDQQGMQNINFVLCVNFKLVGQTFIANNLDLSCSELDGDLLVFEGGDDRVHLDGSFRLVIFDPQPFLLRHTAQLG